MFLKEVLHHNRIMFAGIILFILSFVYINIKWGAVATPVYTPGMFSGKMYRTDTLTTYKLFLGQQQVDLAALHFTKRDMITASINRYRQHQQVNLAVIDLVRKVPGLGSLVNDSWLNKTTDRQFLLWLGELAIGNTPDEEELSVYSVTYGWINDNLFELNPPQKLF